MPLFLQSTFLFCFLSLVQFTSFAIFAHVNALPACRTVVDASLVSILNRMT